MKKTEKKEIFPKKIQEYDSFLEDFDGGNMKARHIDGSYRYVHKNVFYRFFSALFYRGIMTPIAFVYTKLFMHEKIIGKKLLKKAEDGYFLVGNHTQAVADAFTPNTVAFPKKCYVVISPKNFSLPVLGPLLPSLGGLPIPSELSAVRGFTACLETRCREKAAITVYPEAHLWPYCSFIRPFGAESFEYPVRFGKPTYAFTRVYKKRGARGVRSEIYIDGPFFADASLSRREAREKLRDEVYSAMCKRSESGDAEVIRYIKRASDTSDASNFCESDGKTPGESIAPSDEGET